MADLLIFLNIKDSREIMVLEIHNLTRPETTIKLCKSLKYDRFSTLKGLNTQNFKLAIPFPNYQRHPLLQKKYSRSMELV